MITDGLDIESYLIWRGLDYKQSNGSRGVQLNVRECPRCGREDYKVYMNAENGLGNCFGCDTKYTIWNFVKAVLNTEDKRAIAKHIEAAKEALGIRRKPVAKIEIAVEKSTLELPESYELPFSDGRTLNYLLDRGVSVEMQKRYHLRFCDFGVHRYLREGETWRQKFDNRVIIPVFDLAGNLVTFQGRDITGESDKKYLFPVALPGTARFLYNGHEALARRCEEVIVNEGAFDVWSAQAACDAFAKTARIICIGSFGKKLSFSRDGSPSQLEAFKVLKREGGLKRVTIMWDGEAQTVGPALDACDLLVGVGLEPKIALLPFGKDPNEISKEAVFKAWEEARPFTPLLATKWRLRNPQVPT